MTKFFKFFLFLFLFLLFMMMPQGGVASNSPFLEELINPDSITVDHQHIYIPEGISIYIYDLKNFKLKRRIGKQGEGPQEFLLDVVQGVEELFIDVQTPVLIVNSLGKISFFDKNDGSYIREIRSHSRAREFRPLGKGYAGQGMMVEAGIQYRAVNIYNSHLNKIKEVFRVRHHFQLREGLRVLPASMIFDTHDNKLFIAWEADFIIRVFDRNGNHLYNIQKEYERLGVTDQYKKKVTVFFKTDKRYKSIFEMLNLKIIFPPALPAIADLKIDQDKIYVITHRINEGDSSATQCLVFDVQGKYLNEMAVPLKRQNELKPYPYTIAAGKVYQLVEDGELWRLVITEL